jgi:signal transduction histidine kinase
VFENPSGAGAVHQALIYVIFPFAIWAALRLGPIGAASTVLVVSGIAIWSTIHGLGPFADMPVNDSLILLQTFTGVVALMSLTLAASASERRRAEETLRKQVEEMATLNDASKLFLKNIEKQALSEAICRVAVDRFDLSAAWITQIPYEERLASPLGAYPGSLKSDGHLADLLSLIPELHQQILATERTGQAGVIRCQPAFIVENDGILAEKLICSFAVFPLLYGKEKAGMLIVAGADLESFSKEHLLLLHSYANLAAVAMQNSWLFDQVRLGNEHLHALSHLLIEVQEAGRIHLSRELHDESGQAIAALMVNLGLLERDAESPELIRVHAVNLKRIGSEVLDNLHALAVKLRPASLDHLGLVTALEQYIQEFNRQYHLNVQFETVGIDASRLPADFETYENPQGYPCSYRRPCLFLQLFAGRNGKARVRCSPGHERERIQERRLAGFDTLRRDGQGDLYGSQCCCYAWSVDLSTPEDGEGNLPYFIKPVLSIRYLRRVMG